MKKLLYVLLMLFASAHSYGAIVSEEDAKLVGYHYLLQRGAQIPDYNDFRLVYTTGGDIKCLYVFGNEHCFVLVTTDDRLEPVLGYSVDNPFSAIDMPDNLAYFLENYNLQIKAVVQSNRNPDPEKLQRWQDLKMNTLVSSTYKTTSGMPPLISTTWDQSQYYNDNCPYDPAAVGIPSRPLASHCPTGCVATAMAQVMKHWNWPVIGSGSNSYSAGSYGTLSEFFGGVFYGWTYMPNVVTAPNPAVAKLMSDAGISVSMHYTPTNSGANTWYGAYNALKNTFRYHVNRDARKSLDDSTTHYSGHSDADWINLLKAELDAYRPLMYTGSNTSGSASHVWIVDGYNSVDQFHMNWGWGGLSNGYYDVNSLIPPDPDGTGGVINFDDASQEIILFEIYPQCEDDLWTVNHSSMISMGGTMEHGAIQAGSHYGAGGDPIVNVNSGVNTLFIGRWIEVGFNFEGAVMPGRFFEIVPSVSCAPRTDGGGGEGKDIRPVSPVVAASSDEFTVFPNPTLNSISIAYQCKVSGTLQICIKDVSGRSMFTENVNCDKNSNLQHSMDIKDLTPGVYFVDLTLNGEHTVKKIVKL